MPSQSAYILHWATLALACAACSGNPAPAGDSGTTQDRPLLVDAGATDDRGMPGDVGAADDRGVPVDAGATDDRPLLGDAGAGGAADVFMFRGDAGAPQASVMVSASAGGTVAAQGASLRITAGALPADTTVTVRVDAPPAGVPEADRVRGNVYDFGPDGTFFAAPVELSLPAPAGVPSQQTVSVAWFDEDGGRWVRLPTELRGAEAVARVTHFTRFVTLVVPAASAFQPDDRARLAACVATACGGNIQGVWNFVGGCTQPRADTYDCMGSRTQAIVVGTGGMAFGAAGDATFDFDSTGVAETTLPASCVAARMSCAGALDMQTCRGTPATGCACEQPARGEATRGTGSYRVSGNTLELTTGGMTAALPFCVTTEGGRRRLRFSIAEALYQFREAGAAYTQVSVGDHHVCALRVDGSIACWGRNDFGEASPPPGTGFKLVAANNISTCAIRADDTVTCWGNDAYGRFNVPAGRFTRLTSGWGYICGLRAEGSLACWGGPWHFGPPPSGVDFVEVGATLGYGLARRRDGSLVAWGSAVYANVPPGVGHRAIHANGDIACVVDAAGALRCLGPLAAGLTLPTGSFTRVAANGRGGCALRADGTLACFGDTRAPEGTFLDIDAGARFFCARRTDRTLLCWGDNEFGQLNVP